MCTHKCSQCRQGTWHVNSWAKHYMQKVTVIKIYWERFVYGFFLDKIICRLVAALSWVICLSPITLNNISNLQSEKNHQIFRVYLIILMPPEGNRNAVATCSCFLMNWFQTLHMNTLWFLLVPRVTSSMKLHSCPLMGDYCFNKMSFDYCCCLLTNETGLCCVRSVTSQIM